MVETSQNVAAAQVTAAYVVPEGRILLLQNATADFAGGGGQTVTDAQIEVRPVATVNPEVYIALNYYGAAVTGRFINWSGSILVPPTWIVQSAGNFSAGVAANYVNLAIAGLLLPLGNFARV